MNIAIVGAGLAGLTAAFELRDSGHTVDVYEGSDRIGGKLFTVAFDGGPTDMGAEAFIARRPEAKQLVDELGLADCLVSPSGLRSLLYVDGETRAMPAGGVMGIPSTSEPASLIAPSSSPVATPKWMRGITPSTSLRISSEYGRTCSR